MNGNFLSNISGEWIESLFKAWQEDPSSVSPDWEIFFSGFELGSDSRRALDVPLVLKHSAVQSLIYRYRSIGHLLACTDPLSPCQLEHPLLKLSTFDLDVSDLDKTFVSRRFITQRATLREMITVLHETYCREIGVEFMHIEEPGERQWLIDRMEPNRNHTPLDVEKQLQILEKLHQAALFESFLHRRFIGQKRFSLEGGEVLIPLLDEITQACPAYGITDMVLGMAHRGRLNVLAHIFGKPYENIFAEFRDDELFGFIGDGDVKYHQGYSTTIELPDGRLHLTIAANPSHLEAVNPVVEGKCRARQDGYGAGGVERVLPVLIHGDAAFAGQGSVMETLNLSQLDGYRTGGTIHIVFNNQIGFTTPPKDARSSCYATDIAKMLACPVFHIQGESPEAGVHVIRLAMDYRRTFGRDVVVEMICYRRYGHNETDEPAFTQPLMYRKIADRPPVNKLYADQLAEQGVEAALLTEIEQQVNERLQSSLDLAPKAIISSFQDAWSGISHEFTSESVNTQVSAEKLVTLARRVTEIPPELNPHAKIQALLQKRLDAVIKGSGIDWGNAETLAYATLLDEGIPIRLSGQDSRRGTFGHRHSVLHDMNQDNTYIPLASVAQTNASFQVWDSPLSEFGVMGFEYGYSIETPHGLTIWEAQFGDFANAAQVVIDQFISSGETKWGRASGLVLLLPHGYEGQGAEHSSARIERYLQLCSHDNMIVVYPTTPAQMFHLLRRQILQPFRRPLIVFTPKSLLRHPRCISSVDDFTKGAFGEVLNEEVDYSQVRRVLICSGKIYYDLLEEREKRGDLAVAIVRIEQLYPFYSDLLAEIFARFNADISYFWVQEEPENMGAWPFLRQDLINLCGIKFIGRPADNCPAVASHHRHADEQMVIISAAFQN
ncbi:MAG TPA: 2-oxoglutarate dehydrogenase E1 component [Desulfuromonadaceae bacterium]|jgi:2-oxoglutarate dehydrogenase E1 component